MGEMQDIIDREKLDLHRNNLVKHQYEKYIKATFNENLKEQYKDFLKENEEDRNIEYGAWKFLQFLLEK